MKMNARGFTLLEILVVVAIIAVLATFVGVYVVHEPGRAKVEAAKAQIKAGFGTALQWYRMDNGAYPTQEQGLQALSEKPVTPPIPGNYRDECYLRKIPPDPWKNDYVYLVPGRGGDPYEIISYGSDGEPGGENDAADISSCDF